MRIEDLFAPLHEEIASDMPDRINEGVPNPKKLLQALKTFIELASTRDLRTAFQAMKEMGLNSGQIEQIHSAYIRFKGAREKSA